MEISLWWHQRDEDSHSTAAESTPKVWTFIKVLLWTVVGSKSRTFLCRALESRAFLPRVHWILSHKAEQLQTADFWGPSSTAVYSILCRTLLLEIRDGSLRTANLRREPPQTKAGIKSKYFWGFSRNWGEEIRSEIRNQGSSMQT